MRLQANLCVKALKIIEWIMKTPQFAVTDKHVCGLKGQGGFIELTLHIHMLSLRFKLGETTETFQTYIPTDTCLRILQAMEQEVEFEVAERHITLRDAVQTVRIHQVIAQEEIHLPEHTEMREWNFVPVVKHLHEVATEYIGESDLDILFNQGFAYIGNYMYIKRVRHQAPHDMLFPHYMSKLLLACAAVGGATPLIYKSEDPTEPLHVKIGNVDLYTSLYSPPHTQLSEVFHILQPTESVQMSLGTFKAVLDRVGKLSIGEGLFMEFDGEGSCFCVIEDDFQESRLQLEYTGTIPALEMEVSRKGIQRLFHKILTTDEAVFSIDTQNEMLLVQSTHEEMVISIAIA